MESLERRDLLAAAFQEFLDPNPAPGNRFGDTVVPLSTGNVVITSPYDDAGGQDAGAVYLFNGATGELISTLAGSSPNERLGEGGNIVVPLSNGNYLVRSPSWDNGAATDAGAVTFGDGNSGVSGTASAANSLVGTTANDMAGSDLVTLSNGSYLVISPNWDDGSIANAGAVTFGNGGTGVVGAVSASNSLVGSTANDRVGAGGVAELSNGNYVVLSALWDNGIAANAGAATFGNGTTGVTGSIDASNSLVGGAENNTVGSLVAPLTNGNYVVVSPGWDNGSALNVGAVTFGDGDAGVTGVVGVSNSLVGSTANDIGLTAVVPLSNGNYLVRNPFWDDGAVRDAGAVTFGDGTSGVSGTISAANSLVGSTADDEVGRTVTLLSNGNYVVGSRGWDNGAATDAGALTFGDATTGVSGVVGAQNSLVGSQASDLFGAVVTPLSNGNYVVNSPEWDDGAVGDAGAVTFGSGTAGVSGVVSAANSLVGSQENDEVGLSVTALTNGNYVVGSPNWDNEAVANVGAVTFGDGSTGVTGPVGPGNSLVGSTAGDRVGNGGATALSNGNFVVVSANWNHGAATNAGAVTFGNGDAGVVGVVSESNSLVGGAEDDRVGLASAGESGVTPLGNGNYVVRSGFWHNGSAADAGAVTFGNGSTGVSGLVSESNSLVGSTEDDQVGNGGITPLANGGYVVGSYSWDNGAATNAGAMTFGDGNTGVSGAISSANSLVGSTSNDAIGLSLITPPITMPLSNGNYVIGSPNWDNGAAADAGAVTFGNGNAGVTGTIDSVNSALGGAANTGLKSVVLDGVNNSFLASFVEEGGGRVRVGSQVDGFVRTPLIVTTTADSGPGSLRQAILDANDTAHVEEFRDVIAFDIPADDAGHVYYRDDGVAGQLSLANVTATMAADDGSIADIDPDWPHSWWSIGVDSNLPAVAEPVVIDGHSQAGAQGATDTSAALLRVELRGSDFAQTGHTGLVVIGGTTIRGLAINSFYTGILVTDDDGQDSGSNVIEGNYIGTDISGSQAVPNNTGIQLTQAGGGSNTVGPGNVVSGNVETAVRVASSGNIIEGNKIGPSAAGSVPPANLAGWITLMPRSTFDGGTTEGWTTVGGAEAVGGGNGPTVHTNGGNPDGYLIAEDSLLNSSWYWNAPQAFLGNHAAAFGRTLEFDLIQSQTDNQLSTSKDVVLISETAGVLKYDIPNPGSSWTHYEIPLVGGDPWISENTGSAATDSEMVNVLSNLTGLQIRGEYRSGSDSSGIDNVVLNVASLREIPPVASLSSTFDTDAEGWRTVGDADGPTYQNSDGNPDGHLSATDRQEDVSWYWDAPAVYLGDKSAAYGQYLRYDLKQSTSGGQADRADDLVLIGRDHQLRFDIGIEDHPGTDWTHYDVLLDPAAGWKDAAGQAVSEDQFRDVLSSLLALRVRGEYSDQVDTGGLDNVVLELDASASATAPRGNLGQGILMEGAGSRNTISNNVIAYNGLDGVNVASAENNNIVIVEPGWKLEQSVTLNGATAAHFNPRDGHVYVGTRDLSSNGVHRIESDGSTRRIATTDHISGLAINPVSGDIFVSEDFGGNIYRIPYGTTTRELWVSGFHAGDDDPAGIAIAPSDYTGTVLAPGEALVVDRGSGGPDEIWKFTPDTSEGEVLVRGDDGTLVDPLDIAIGRDAVYVIDHRVTGEEGRIYRLENDASLTPVGTSQSVGRPSGIAVDPVSGELLVLDRLNGRVLRVDSQSGSVSTIFSGFDGAAWGGIDITPDGKRMIVTEGGRVSVFLNAPGGNAILGNSIFANAGLGIDLVASGDDAGGVTPNDADDADEGPNRLQNFPEIQTATFNGNTLDLQYAVPSATAYSAYPLRVEFFQADADGQEGKTFLGFDTYTAQDAQSATKLASFTPTTAIAGGDKIVATATDADGNTSEFLAPQQVVGSSFSIAESDGGTQVSETGATDTFTVVLDVPPASDVVLNVTSADTGEATVSPTTLTFTPDNWNQPQIVTVTGVDDDLTDGDQQTVITVWVDAANSDDNFDSLADQTLIVTTTDDDAAGLSDLGDAPDDGDDFRYDTINGDPARHILDGVTYLGAGVDADDNGQPNADASGDDNDADGDDEDGVVLPTTIIAGQTTTASVTASAPGVLSYWIDANRNGVFDNPDERFTHTFAAAGSEDVPFRVPPWPGTTYARFRFSTVQVDTPDGLAPDGEVEDYRLDVLGPAEIDLNALLPDGGGDGDGSRGFVINGAAAGDQSGVSVSSAGDFNGDGFEDLLIGAWQADPGGDDAAGAAYVVYGRVEGFSHTVDLASINGRNGVKIEGVDAGDITGYSVSPLGDVNGDGFDDLIIGAPHADPHRDTDAGAAYVVFGRSGAPSFNSTIDLAALDGTNGFRITGIASDQAPDLPDKAGWSVSGAGDFNGDGLNDILLGAPWADPIGLDAQGQPQPFDDAGEAYVIYGHAGRYTADFDLSSLDGTNGFRIAGLNEEDRLGFVVSGVGDINGDRLDDIAVAAPNADPGGRQQAGETYFIFGRGANDTPFSDVFYPATLDGALDGVNGFRIDGTTAQDLTGDRSGVPVANAGDLNGDFVDDLVIGSIFGDRAYIVFGQTSGEFQPVIDLATLAPADGFVIEAAALGELQFLSASIAGDVNGDGHDDLILGGPKASGEQGKSFVVYGRAADDPFPPVFNLSALDGLTGLTITGVGLGDQAGISVSSAGDVNGDGYADLILGAPFNDSAGADAGQTYVLFGGNFTGAVTHAAAAAGDAGGNVMVGTSTSDEIVAGGGADVINAGAGDDVLAIADLAFQRINAGRGTDTLRLDMRDQILDLVSVLPIPPPAPGVFPLPPPRDRIQGIEVIDITGLSPNTLILDRQAVLNASHQSNALKVIGDEDDAVVLLDTWTELPPSGDFRNFQQGNAALQVSSGIPIVLGGGISGTKWEDLDGDGERDTNEPGLDGWTIELVDPPEILTYDSRQSLKVGERSIRSLTRVDLRGLVIASFTYLSVAISRLTMPRLQVHIHLK